MPLEDHLGEILRKAREAAGLSVEDAAALASRSTDDYRLLEETGVCPATLELRKLAERVNLQPGKLQSIAEGWVPASVDLSRWRELERITTKQENLTVHCYLIWDEVSREAALFDTGWRAQPILESLARHELDLRHVFLTHTHDDHMGALGALRQQFPKLRLHTNSKNAPPQHRNRPNDFIHLGSLRVTNRDTPGHTEDGVCYLAGNWPDDAPHVAFVGDTLFAGSVGTGHVSLALLLTKAREQLLSLPHDTLVCPGHGPLTTIGEERAHNPFFDTSSSQSSTTR